eukprot:scaffold119010_cov72-Phaeocystis_antarctica.AAC.2
MRWARRAPGRWPRGRPWLLCAHPSEIGTAGHQRSAPRTRRPTAQRAGLPPPRSRAAPAATRLHPSSTSTAASHS